MQPNVTPPEGQPVYEGEIASYWFEDGILVSLSKPVRRTVPLIAGNVALVKELTGGRPVPLLIYLSPSPVPDKETRAFSTTQLPVIYSAMAMISPPGLSRLIMNLLFRFQSPPIPMKSFRDVEEAKAWLRQFL